MRVWRPVSVPGALGLRSRPSREILRAYLARPGLDLAAYRAKSELALRFDARPWLPPVSCPAFVLIGTWDPVVPPRAGRELAGLLPGAELHCLWVAEVSPRATAGAVHWHTSCRQSGSKGA